MIMKLPQQILMMNKINIHYFIMVNWVFMDYLHLLSLFNSFFNYFSFTKFKEKNLKKLLKFVAHNITGFPFFDL